MRHPTTRARAGKNIAASKRDDEFVSDPRRAVELGQPFVGKAARAENVVSAAVLRKSFRRVLPDVYVGKSVEISPKIWVRACWLWSPTGSVLAGGAAALMLGEKSFAKEIVPERVDLFTPHVLRTPRGIRARQLRRAIEPGSVGTVGDMGVTSPARTAVDLARWEPNRDQAICMVDSMCNSTKTPIAKVYAACDGMKGLHGVKRVLDLLPECHPGADSPPETRLRLLITRSGLPTPEVQLPIFNRYGAKLATADLGYAKEQVAIFYDGFVHGQSSTWDYDAMVNGELHEAGWDTIRITKQMMRNPPTILRRIENALAYSRATA